MDDVKDSWIYSAEFAVADGDGSPPITDRQIEVLDNWLKREYEGSAQRTSLGWRASVKVCAGGEIFNLERAGVKGKKVIDTCNDGVNFPRCAMVSQQAILDDVYVAQLETLSISELLGAAEVCGQLGITRQRLHQLRQTGRFPEPDRELTATPLWMRSTLRDFTVGWRRTPGPTPRPMDMDGLLATGSMRWE